jgi:hypothetical protein
MFGQPVGGVNHDAPTRRPTSFTGCSGIWIKLIRSSSGALSMFDAALSALQVIKAGSVPRRDALAGVAALAVSMVIASSRRVAAVEPVPLRIGGTGMALAAMRQIADAFTAAQPQTTVTILPSLGTGGGLAAVAAGAIDVAVAARGLNDAERAQGLQGFSYARTPLAFVTHPNVGVEGVNLGQN